MQKWILFACVILIVTSIFQMLTPNGPLKGIMNFVLNLFFIGIVMMPFFKNISTPKIKNYFDHNLQNPSTEQIQKNINQLNKKNLENALKLLLEKHGYRNFNVQILNSQQKTTKILISFPKNEDNIDLNKLKTLVESQTQIVPEIIFD